MTRVVTRSPRETVDLGREFSRRLHPGAVVALMGTLGSGKTQFVAGICEGLGVKVRATSPTFTIVNEYDAPTARIIHCDLYRIAKQSELRELGIEEYFNDRNICVIEWAEMMISSLPEKRFEVLLSHGASDTERVIAIEEAP